MANDQESALINSLSVTALLSECLPQLLCLALTRRGQLSRPGRKHAFILHQGDEATLSASGVANRRFKV
ncbi:hypothetical protein, partial [Pseudomonas viridiflava]|uniref:hypothetical protein n=1 Tax=Pseudomonas viridiflava TaxID=33069 RepID=UPI001F11D08D